MPEPKSIIPIYTTKGDAEAFLVYPNLFNRSGEWIGWVTREREVYSVLGYHVGTLSTEPRILRKRSADPKPRLAPPFPPKRVHPPATIPLAPMMRELMSETIDVLLEEPERLHTLDLGELREDLD
jgi:hypothetical protein